VLDGDVGEVVMSAGVCLGEVTFTSSLPSSVSIVSSSSSNFTFMGNLTFSLARITALGFHLSDRIFASHISCSILFCLFSGANSSKHISRNLSL
jgi:hypothetical protein